MSFLRENATSIPMLVQEDIKPDVQELLAKHYQGSSMIGLSILPNYFMAYYVSYSRPLSRETLDKIGYWWLFVAISWFLICMIILANLQAPKKHGAETSNVTPHHKKSISHRTNDLVEIFPAWLLSSAEDKDERMHLLDQEVAEWMMGGYGSFQPNDVNNLGGEPIDGEEELREMRELWYWCVIYYTEVAVMSGFALVLLIEIGNSISVFG